MARKQPSKKIKKPKRKSASRPAASPRRPARRVDTEERLRLALTSARMGIWEWDIKTNEVIWSTAMERLFGLEPGEFGNSFDAYLKLVHPDDQEHCQRTIQDYLAGKTKTFALQNRVIFRDGEIHWVEGRGEVYRDRKGTPLRMLGTVMDITETKRVEEELRRNEGRLRQAQHIARLGIWDWNIITDRTNWSGAMFEIYGITEKEFTGKGADYLKFTHPDDRARQMENIKNAFAQAAKSELTKDRTREAHIVPREFRIVHPSGDIRYVMGDSKAIADEKGQPLGMLGTLIDITDFKRATDGLRDSKHFVERIALASPHLMYVFDIAQQSFYWSNREFGRDLGYSPEEILKGGSNFIMSLVHPDDLARIGAVIARWDTAKDGELLEVEYRMKNARGEWRWFLGRDTIFQRDTKGKVTQVIGTAEDITNRKHSELALLESQRFVESIALASPHIMYVFDIAEQRNVWSNRQIGRDLGYSPEQVHTMGKEFLPRLMHPEELPKLAELLTRWDKAKDGELLEVEYRMKHADGSWRWFLGRDTIFQRDTSGKVKQIIGTAEDITARKTSDMALRESQRFIEKIAQASPFVIYVYDVSKEQLVWANRHLGVDMGYTLEEVIQMGAHMLAKLVHPEDFQKLMDYRKRQIFAKEGEVLEGEYRVKHADGSWRHLLSRDAVFQRDEQGRPLQVIGSAQDITERKKLEEQLLQAQKMESVGRLAGGVAHDFNNLLTAMIGFTELCIKLEPENSTAQSYLKNIQEAANRGAKLTQQLLAFARKQVIELKPINLNALMQNCTELLRRLIGEDIEVTTIPAKNLWPVNADPHQLEQVLMNLALNARDAMPAGGRITLETTNLSVDKDFFHGAADLPAGDYIQLSVSDTGHGIPQKLLAHIFEPFFTTKPQGKGTGLGLATCYGIIKQHHGHILVYSEPDKGTTFKVYLPRSTQGAAVQDRPHTPSGILSGRETIMIVEDFDMLRSIAELVLQQHGYQVLCAVDGIDALLKARAYAARIDLLVTDVVMPRMGGKELARALQAERPEMKVLFSSGYTENAIAHHGVLDPGIHFIQKPYRPVALAEKVRSILNG